MQNEYTFKKDFYFFASNVYFVKKQKYFFKKNFFFQRSLATNEQPYEETYLKALMRNWI